MEKNPRVNWPEKSGEYKVVQLVVDGVRYIRFGSLDSDFHREILEDALVSFDISYDIIIDGDKDVPSPKGERYEAVGMGKADIDINSKTARFKGRSYGYLIPINKKHLEEIQKEEKEWKIE